MSYKLEMIHVNRKENLFLFDTNNVPQRAQEIYNKKVKQFQDEGKLSNYKRDVRRFQRNNGDWQWSRTVSDFTTIEDAVQFFSAIRQNDEDGMREMRRKWHNEHVIFAETNVLDENNDIVKVIHSCQNAICEEFGNCSTSTKGCDIVHHRETRFSVVYHIKPI